MNDIILTNQEKSDLLHKHKCPSCGSYDVIFYNPNLADKEVSILGNDTIQIEFECQSCPLYTIIIAKLYKFFDNRR